MSKKQYFTATCPTRVLFAEISDKWSMMILCVLEDEAMRFNEIKRRLEGVSQKSLTLTLRRLERNGIIDRTVLDTSPISVSYSITDMGRSLLAPFKALYCWTNENIEAVNAARESFDARQEKAVV